MNLEKQLLDAAMNWGADYFGIADLSPWKTITIRISPCLTSIGV